jgi:hypothetical protein
MYNQIVKLGDKVSAFKEVETKNIKNRDLRHDPGDSG